MFAAYQQNLSHIESFQLLIVSQSISYAGRFADCSSADNLGNNLFRYDAVSSAK